MEFITLKQETLGQIINDKGGFAGWFQFHEDEQVRVEYIEFDSKQGTHYRIATPKGSARIWVDKEEEGNE